MTTLLRNIGELVTNNSTWGDRFGIIESAAVEIDDGRVSWVGDDSDASSRSTADVVDVGGRTIIPGFVDAHTHLVFAGDRSREFEARMAGAPYSAGGITSTVRDSRSATDDDLRALLATRIEDMRHQGTLTVEVKTGYGLTVEHEARLARLAAEVTPHVTFLGAHVVPPEFDGRRDEYVDLVCGDMLDAVAGFVTAIDVFCETGAFTVDQSRRILEVGQTRGLRTHIHAAQLGESDAVTMAVELGVHSVDHGTHLSDTDIDALAASGTIITLLPGADFSTRQPYPDARRLIDAGVTVALASNCNPGSSNTTSIPFCIALAVREMGMTPREAVWAATAGAGLVLGDPSLGVIAPGNPAKLVELDAPNHIHLAYRPGASLVRRVWI